MPDSDLILGIVAAAAALAYLPFRQDEHGWPRSVVKTTPLLCGAIASILVDGPALLGIGLLLSALGDFALSRSGQRAFLGGLGAFALAHIAYGALFLGLGERPVWQVFVPDAGLAPVLAIFMLILALSTEQWLAPYTGSLRWPVRIYVVLIGAMMLSALTLPEPARSATYGAGLFVLSDMILAIRMFRLKDQGAWAAPAGWGVWVFYIAGQALIFWGVVGL